MAAAKLYPTPTLLLYKGLLRKFSKGGMDLSKKSVMHKNALRSCEIA